MTIWTSKKKKTQNMDDIVFVLLNEQEVTSTLRALEGHMYSRG
jgi:hypothetical protein